MARFMIEAPHTAEDCVEHVDSIFAFSKDLWSRTDWGCRAGEHTGWAVLEAGDEQTVRMLLPSTIRAGAKVVPLNKFTVEEVQSWHAEPKDGGS